jgi:hypothetical protein
MIAGEGYAPPLAAESLEGGFEHALLAGQRR